MNHDPGLGQVTHHGHVTPLALAGPGRIPFFRNDPGGVDIQSVGPALQLAQTLGHDPAIHPVQPHQTCPFSGATQPVPRRVRAGQMIQMQQAA